MVRIAASSILSRIRERKIAPRYSSGAFFRSSLLTRARVPRPRRGMHEKEGRRVKRRGTLLYGPVWENNGRTVSQSCFMGCNCGLARGGQPRRCLSSAWPAPAFVRSHTSSAATCKADRSVTVLTFATKHETSFRPLGARLRLRASDLRSLSRPIVIVSSPLTPRISLLSAADNHAANSRRSALRILFALQRERVL